MSKKKYVAEHIFALDSQVKKTVYSRNDLAQRYVDLIRRLSMKFRFRLPRFVKRSYCKHCYTPFAPGKNCRVRTRDGKLVYTCFSCKKYTRIPLK